MLRLCPRTTPTQRRDGNTAPSREEENAVNTEIQVDRLVIQANRAKLADKYERRLTYPGYAFCDPREEWEGSEGGPD